MRHGKLNCPGKGIWCIWTNLNTGTCDKSGDCDVGTPEWEERKREEEQAIEESRRRAEAERKKETEETRKLVEVKRERTELQDISDEIQHLEARMCRCYQQGREKRADELLWKIVKLKRKAEELKNEKKK